MRWFVLCLLVMSVGSCSSGILTVENRVFLEQLVHTNELCLTYQWAMPTMSSAMTAVGNSGILGPGQSTQRIDLASNTNFLEIKGDSIKTFLPYFGVRHMGGGYDNDGSGIEIEGLVRSFNRKLDTIKGLVEFQFSASDDAELFQFNLQVFPNKTTSLLVQSSQRDPIRYQGRLKETQKEDLIY